MSVDETKTRTLSAYGILLGAQLAIGSAAIFARYALQGAQPLAVSALRLVIAGVPLFLWSMRTERRALPARHEYLFALSGLFLAIHFSTWFASLQYTSVAVSTLLVSTSPLWTGLWDVIVLKSRYKPVFWIALCTSAVGVVLIVSDHNCAAPIKGHALLGSLLAAFGAASLAGYLIAVKRISQTYSTILIVGRTYAWAALCLCLSALATHEGPPALTDGQSWFGIIAMAIVAQLLGHTALNASLRWFDSSTVAFSTLLEPVFAAALAAWLLRENLSALAAAGCATVFVSLFIVLKYSKNAAIAA